ncbi:YgjV family protein [uncultured Parolsenella sp.]|uniref:YgjV family protein n=1 Tax=uncultured Parolsenella sp. TaxID=2083008 RepID=UPI0027D96E20|nr:YgjV family protein [uncultured Parolsenella sp.]
MDSSQAVELFGYVASAIVLVSLVMSNTVKLRVLNATGAALYVVYALIIGSYPTAVMNACLVAIDLYHLVKILRHKEPTSELGE